MEGLWLLFFVDIEEGIALSVLGLNLLGIRPGGRHILTMGIVQGLFIYLIRTALKLTVFPPFVKGFLILLSLIVIIKVVTKIRIGLASAAGMLAFLVLLLSEIFVLPMVYSHYNLNPVQVSTSPWVYIRTIYAGDALLFILALLTTATKFSLVPAKFRGN